MLLGLTIRDVVLIDRLRLAFRPGLCVLTGETGAGKSILLDALALALGRRADASLVRPGAEQAAVSAEFAVGAQPSGARPSCARPGIATDLAGTIVLRRLVGADGRSRAFVNDEPASVGLLRELGDSLVEIQGQCEQRGLLDPATHRELLDAFAEHEVSPARSGVSLARLARGAGGAPPRRRAVCAEARAEEDLLRHHLAELDALAPEGDEEDRLAARRALLQNAERLGEAILSRGDLAASSTARAARKRALARAAAPAGTRPRPGARAARQCARRRRARRRRNRRGARRAECRRRTRSSSTRARSNRSRSGSSRCARSPASTMSRSPICRGCTKPMAARLAAIEAGAEGVVAPRTGRRGRPRRAISPPPRR